MILYTTKIFFVSQIIQIFDPDFGLGVTFIQTCLTVQENVLISQW